MTRRPGARGAVDAAPRATERSRRPWATDHSRSRLAGSSRSLLTDSFRGRLLLAFLVVSMVTVASVGTSILVVGPGDFVRAMGIQEGGRMSEAMEAASRQAFAHAIGVSFGVGALIAIVAATVVSLAAVVRVTRPLGDLARAARRLASGRYSERVRPDRPGELGDIADSFNEIAGSLEATEQERRRLIGDVAHELRTPLTTIGGYLEGIEDGVIAPSAETWHLLRAEATRLSTIVDDLAELWRAEDGRIELRPGVVDVVAVADDEVDPFRPAATARGVGVRVFSTGVVLAIADPTRLRRILAEYLANALRHAPSGSSISVHASRAGPVARIAVTDEGPGLAADQLDAVFERFYRVDPSRRSVDGGAGIGLALSRALAEAMSGRAWADSPGPGKGATFYVDLPPA